MSQIRVLKLTTGEEVIASTHQVGSSLTLHKPRVVQLVATETGATLMLMPWIQVDPDNSVQIDVDKVITSLDANSQVEKAYLQRTSGIDLGAASNGSILRG